MHPVVFTSRVYEPGGLWTPKIGGVFVEGDPASSSYYVEGKVDIREMADHLKVFFEDIKIVKRKIVLLERQREEITAKYMEKVSQFKQQRRNMGQEVSDSEDEDEDVKLAKKSKRDNELQALFTEEENKEIPLPRLFVYMCKKKPRARMTDIHKSGSRVHIYSRSDGLFGREGTLNHFEASLKDVPDALEYLGIVVVKLPGDPPKTEEPVVYGFAKLQSARSIKIKTRQAIGIGDLVDELSKILEAQQQQYDLEHSKDKGKPKVKKVSDYIKPLHHYREIANQAWAAFQKQQDDTVDNATFLQMIDFSNIFLVNVQAQRIFQAVDVSKQGRLGISEFENFLMAYDVLSQASGDILLLDTYDSLKQVADTKTFGEFGRNAGLDYSGFVEAIQVLGIRSKEEKDLVEAFVATANIKESQLSTTYISLQQFKKAWLKLANIEMEMANRHLKYESGLMAGSRNRERLLKILNDQEAAYLDNLSKINEMVENVKRDRRMKHDEAKREAEAVRDKYMHDAEKFIAVRGKEKRVQIKQEQEEKSRKRVEAKVLKNQLAQRQAEALRAKQVEVLEKAKAAEKLRSDQIVAMGWDRLDMSVQKLRDIPTSMYHTDEATTRLSYAVNVDFSRNILERIPKENFFYWMTEARKLKLSQNRIVNLPEDLSNMVKLEILELDSNKLIQIPQGMSQLTALQRLDISNNRITALPSHIGNCAQLRYIYAHSNQLNSIPPSLGECFRLEFVDLSNNLLRELPEDFEHLITLTYLNLSGNSLIQLPHRLGSCSKLRYLDVSTNRLVTLPDNFSSLTNLELCDFQNNDLLLSAHKLDQLTSLKKLLLSTNQITSLYNDLGACQSLTYLDLRCNHVASLPPDIGLLTNLQELHITRNCLTYLPPELGACRSLQVLNLDYNRLHGQLPDTFGLATSLITVDLSNNQITGLPESIVALVKLESLNLTSNLLTALPDSITFLDKLSMLNLSANKIATIPLQLLKMTFLQSLNLSNNLMTYLPRSVNALTFLQSLDMRHNLLKAVPVEFTDIFESVPEVNLHNNPWTDLPLRWGKMWEGKQSSDGATGYSLSEAVEFLYGMRAVYPTAERVWQEQGIYHYTHRMTLKDFIAEIVNRIPHSWHDGLLEHVEYLYIKSRETGAMPVFHELTKDQQRERMYLQQMSETRRSNNIAKVMEETVDREARRHAAYDNTSEIIHRAHQVEALIAEQRVNEKVSCVVTSC
jgi:Leucine-rich repeat (LRR) protein